jgi:hypothetical protein
VNSFPLPQRRPSVGDWVSVFSEIVETDAVLPKHRSSVLQLGNREVGERRQTSRSSRFFWP